MHHHHHGGRMFVVPNRRQRLLHQRRVRARRKAIRKIVWEVVKFAIKLTWRGLCLIVVLLGLACIGLLKLMAIGLKRMGVI